MRAAGRPRQPRRRGGPPHGTERALWIAAYYQNCRTALTAWRRQYRRATTAQRARMRATCDPREAAALLNTLGRLYDE